MPKPAQHQDKADHNRAFLNTLTDDTFCDWIAVVAFYTAVHLIEKLFAYEGEHHDNHNDRNAAVRREHRAIHSAFHELYNWSLVARYRTLGSFTHSAPDVRSILVERHLVAVEKYVAAVTHIKSSPRPP